MNKLVYSSQTGSHKKDKPPKSNAGGVTGPIKVRLEKKGRGGKSVTVLFNLPFDGLTAKEIKKSMAAHLGTGSTYKDGRIEFQGDHLEKVLKYLQLKGYKAVKAGG